MQRFIFSVLGLGMALSGISCVHEYDYDYDYSIGIINDGPTTLVAYPFELYPEDIPVAAFGSIGGVIDDYSKKPNKYLDIYWMEEVGSSYKMHSGVFPDEFEQIYWHDKSPGKYNKFHVRLDMTLPEQFTPLKGKRIEFRFYKGNVLVVYNYECPEYEDSQGRKTNRRRILSDGTPCIGNDFANYMDQNPGATTEDFMKHQRKKYGIQ